MRSELNTTALLRALRWPLGLFSLEEILARVAQAKRFIDFDETVFDNSERRPFDLLCGKPIAEFLREEPFIVQTWNSDPENVARVFVEAAFPEPLLIIAPPCKDIIHSPPFWYPPRQKFIRESVAKDFEALGLKNIVIIDDFVDNFGIHAPGCTLLAPR